MRIRLSPFDTVTSADDMIIHADDIIILAVPMDKAVMDPSIRG